jgi:hypothetical protein
MALMSSHNAYGHSLTPQVPRTCKMVRLACFSYRAAALAPSRWGHVGNPRKAAATNSLPARPRVAELLDLIRRQHGSLSSARGRPAGASGHQPGQGALAGALAEFSRKQQCWWHDCRALQSGALLGRVTIRKPPCIAMIVRLSHRWGVWKTLECRSRIRGGLAPSRLCRHRCCDFSAGSCRCAIRCMHAAEQCAQNRLVMHRLTTWLTTCHIEPCCASSAEDQRPRQLGRPDRSSHRGEWWAEPRILCA